MYVCASLFPQPVANDINHWSAIVNHVTRAPIFPPYHSGYEGFVHVKSHFIRHLTWLLCSIWPIHDPGTEWQHPYGDDCLN